MRKVLAVMLVLGMASLASATPVAISSSDITGTYSGTTFTIKGNVVKELSFGIYDDSGISTTDQWVAGEIKGAAGGLGSMANSGYAGLDFGTLALTTGDNPVPISVGNWFTFTYTGTAGKVGGNYVFSLYDYTVSATQAVGTVTFTPEPATLAILGLGGLLLRRK